MRIRNIVLRRNKLQKTANQLQLQRNILRLITLDDGNETIPLN